MRPGRSSGGRVLASPYVLKALGLILRIRKLGTPVILNLGRWRQEAQKYKEFETLVE